MKNKIIKIVLDEHWQNEDLSTDQPWFFRAFLPQDAFIIKASVSMQPDQGIVSVRLRTADNCLYDCAK